MGTRGWIGAVTLATLFAWGCGGDDSTADDGGSAGTTSSGGNGGTVSTGGAGGSGGGVSTGGMGGAGGSGGMMAMLTQDPCQGGTALTFWLDDNQPHTTPETAKVEGIVEEPVVYIEGTIDPVAGVYFYSFCTGAAFTEFPMVLFANDAMIDFVHVHDATGLVFGAEVPPSSMVSPVDQSWTLQPSTPYVLEVHAPGGGFF